MKAIFCEICGDVVAPCPLDMKPRWCDCGRHAVWWRDGARGLLSVYDKHRQLVPVNENLSRYTPSKVYVLGFSNSWLMHPKENLTAEDYQSIVAAIPESYIFKVVGSVAIRFRPGNSNDTKFEDKLP